MLDDEDEKKLRERLLNYKEEPDNSLWEKISAKVSDEESSVANRLANYKEEPDEAIWSSINKSLVEIKFLSRLESLSQIVSLLSIFIFISSLLLSGQRADNITSSKNESPVIDSLRTANETTRNNSIKEKADALRSENNSKETSLAQAGSTKTSTNSKGHSQNIIQNKEKSIDHVSSQHLENTKHEITSNESLINRKTIADFDESKPEKITENSESVILPPVDSSTSIGNKVIAADSIAKKTESIVKKDTIANHVDDPEKDSKEKTEIKSSLYFLIMPTLGYQQVRPTKDDGIIIESYEKIASFSPKRLGIRAEIGWEKKVSSRLSVSAGLLYFQRQQTFNYSYTDSIHFEIIPTDQSFSYEIKPQLLPGSYTYQVRNIGFIGGLNYTLNGTRFNQKFGVAIEFHKSLNGGKGIYLFGDAYYRVSYILNKRFDLIFQPTLNYGLQLNEPSNAPFYIKPYGLGLSIGAYIKLGIGKSAK